MTDVSFVLQAVRTTRVVERLAVLCDMRVLGDARLRAQMRAHLRIEHRLHGTLDRLPQKVRIVDQELWIDAGVTSIAHGHRILLLIASQHR